MCRREIANRVGGAAAGIIAAGLLADIVGLAVTRGVIVGDVATDGAIVGCGDGDTACAAMGDVTSDRKPLNSITTPINTITPTTTHSGQPSLRRRRHVAARCRMLLLVIEF
jgi:hypothetical protein